MISYAPPPGVGTENYTPLELLNGGTADSNFITQRQMLEGVFVFEDEGPNTVLGQVFHQLVGDGETVDAVHCLEEGAQEIISKGLTV